MPKIGKENIMRKHNVTEISLAQILRENSETGTDSAFERPHGCWTKEQEQAFLKSMLEGFMCSPITRANVQQCLQYSKRIGDSVSFNYFKNKAQLGHSWISLDGKHRRETIVKFLEDKISYTGHVTVANGNRVHYTNTFFKDMSDAAQASIMSLQIMVNEFVAVIRKDLPKVFIGLNSGALPTDQHLRNAEDTPIAAKTRDLHSDFKGLFENLCSSRQITSMMPEEIISKMILHLESKKRTSITSKAINELYRKGHSVGAEGEYSTVYDINSLILLKSILTEMSQIDSIKKEKVINSKNSLIFFLVLENIVRNELTVTDYELFYSEITKLDSYLERESTKEVLNLEDNNVAYNKHDYYYFWARQKWANIYRYNRQDAIWSEISKDYSKYGITQVDNISEEESEEDAA